jgi:hypothetical protein
LNKPPQLTVKARNMKVSIRTAYRIVKKVEDPEVPIFIPQYQEEGSEDWHIFKNRIHGKGGGYNTVYFFTFAQARRYIDHQIATRDVIIYYDDESGEWVENAS